jgi:hypothetical protein
MEAKLAEFRKKHAQKKPLINWYEISSRFSSIFSSKQKSNEEIEEEGEESVTNWKIILIKFLLWLTSFVIFIRIEFGAIYFIVSLLYLMWCSLDRRRRRNELSAYSVFNPNFEKIQGTFSGEDYERQLRRGGAFSS